MSSSPEYRSLIPILFHLSEMYVEYSASPPRASLEEFNEARLTLKDWLSNNAVDSDQEVWQAAKEIGIQCDNYTNEGRIRASLIGGDGRPDEGRLLEQKEELRANIEAIIQRIRTLGVQVEQPHE